MQRNREDRSLTLGLKERPHPLGHESGKILRVTVLQRTDDVPGNPFVLPNRYRPIEGIPPPAARAIVRAIPACLAIRAQRHRGRMAKLNQAGDAHDRTEASTVHAACGVQEVNRSVEQPARSAAPRSNGAAEFRLHGAAIIYTGMMSVTILLFASVAEAVGQRRIEFPDGEGLRVGDIRDALMRDYPVLEAFIPNLLFALNEQYADEATAVPAGSTLALIPPVSGGT